MDIAISGIVIIFLLLPGISFNKGYYSGEFSRKYLSNDFYSLFVSTLFPSLFIYLISFPIVYFIFGYGYDIRVFLGIISSNDELVSQSIEAVNRFIVEIIVFQLVVNLGSYFFGKVLHDIILKYSLDTKVHILRFNNIWHYLITGRFLQYRDVLNIDTVQDIDLTFVDALVNINNQTFIYTGILIDYQLGKDGTLDLLIITKAQRKLVSVGNEEDYRDIRGNYLVLKYSDLINVNLSFIQIEPSVNDTGEITEVELRLIN